MTDTMIDPESFLSGEQRLAMQTAKKCWHQHLADGGDEISIAVAMMARPVCDLHKIDILTAGRVGARLLMKANETLLEIALEDIASGTLDADADEIRATLEKARASRIASEAASAPEKPKASIYENRPILSVVPDPVSA
ncbi:MAG: hypothetical protein M9932_02095 [Xanthobacteraceae bacterium]|nr:hypothetical protein [Xanthobacteraceae bacterium]